MTALNLIVEELDQCWEVTQDPDKAWKIEKALFETQTNVKTETTFMYYVARRNLKFSAVGRCAGDTSANSDQGLSDTTRRESCRKQLRKGGDVDRWQIR